MAGDENSNNTNNNNNNNGNGSGALVLDPYGVPDVSPMHITDYPVNFDELLPVETFFGTTEGLDWVCICCSLEKTRERERLTGVLELH